MKKVIRCHGCSQCAEKQPFGFVGDVELWCTRTHEVVDHDDGCTKGSPGKKMSAASAGDVDLGSDHTAHGWSW